MSAGQKLLKLIIAGISLTSIGYFLYESITREMKDTHQYSPYYVSPSVEECSTGTFNTTAPPTYALLDKSYIDQSNISIDFVKANCTIATLLYNKPQQICDMYSKKSEFWINSIDQRKLQLIFNTAFYSFLTFMMLFSLVLDFCTCQCLLRFFRCPQNQQQIQRRKFYTFFLCDCLIAPATLYFITTIRQECFQPILIIKSTNFQLQFTTAINIGLGVFIGCQYGLITILLKFWQKCRFLVIILIGCIIVDIICMVVTSLDQPGWLIGITSFKLAMDLVGLCCTRRGNNQNNQQQRRNQTQFQINQFHGGNPSGLKEREQNYFNGAYKQVQRRVQTTLYTLQPIIS